MRPRKRLAIFAVVMFILCFTPAPIEPLESHNDAERIDVDRGHAAPTVRPFREPRASDRFAHRPRCAPFMNS